MSAETPAVAADDWMNLRRVNPVFRTFVSPIASCWLVYDMRTSQRSCCNIHGRKHCCRGKRRPRAERDRRRGRTILDAPNGNSVCSSIPLNGLQINNFLQPLKQTSVRSRPFQITHPFRGHRKFVRFETSAFDDQVEQRFLRRVAIDGFFQYPE